MPQALSSEEIDSLIALADKTLFVLDTRPHYVLIARWNTVINRYTPHLISATGFIRDPKAILLKSDYQPKLRTELNSRDIPGPEKEPEDNIVTGSVDPVTGRLRIVIDFENRNKPVKSAPFKKWLDHKNMKPYSFPQDLDSIYGWSNDKESALVQSLKNDGLYVDEAEPIKPKLSAFKEGQKPEIKKYWIDILNSTRDELKLKYSLTEIDIELNHALGQQFEFDNLYSIKPLHEMLCENPSDIKQSLLQDLYFSGALKDFSFKMKATAFLLAKGFRNAEEAVFIFRHQCLGLRRFYPQIAVLFAGIYTENDFYIYQSVLEGLLTKLLILSFSDRNEFKHLVKQNSIWPRVKRIREEFTQKQTEIVQLLYINRPIYTYDEAAKELGISIDSVRDREEGVINKMKKEFIEFKNCFPYKDYHKNNQRIWSYIGCRHNPTADKIHPCYRVRIQNDCEVKESITHGELIAEKLNRNLGLTLKTKKPAIAKTESCDEEIDILGRKGEPLNTAIDISPN
nr:hypothetical protein HAGR004_19550 [Bdellovibrio sp. HAGR004]